MKDNIFELETPHAVIDFNIQEIEGFGHLEKIFVEIVLINQESDVEKKRKKVKNLPTVRNDKSDQTVGFVKGSSIFEIFDV